MSCETTGGILFLSWPVCGAERQFAERHSSKSGRIHKRLKLRNELDDYHCDQKFLKAQWPVLQTSVMVHDEFGTVAQPLLPKAFPTRRYKGQFVGQSYNEREQALIDIEGNVGLTDECTNLIMRATKKMLSALHELLNYAPLDQIILLLTTFVLGGRIRISPYRSAWSKYLFCAQTIARGFKQKNI